MLILIAVFIFIPERFGESVGGKVLAYAILGVIDAICCFFIIRQNPRSFWYIFLIINAPLIIITAIAEDLKTTDWIAYCGIWGASIIASIIGARIGKMKAIIIKSINFPARQSLNLRISRSTNSPINNPVPRTRDRALLLIPEVGYFLNG